MENSKGFESEVGNESEVVEQVPAPCGREANCEECPLYKLYNGNCPF
jgi:hypothetical protein